LIAKIMERIVQPTNGTNASRYFLILMPPTIQRAAQLTGGPNLSAPAMTLFPIMIAIAAIL
jgi:hypothetical protein